MSNSKSLCDWSKSELKENARELALLVAEANHYCTKCGRVANDKQVLCKAKKLPRVTARKHEQS
ncbi:hypothetical protein [Aeoliella mucimassa]|uniref:hypothetical protein n=1 Tax=Aeoliella mucimassa TaxID=2527972 RepID=UPI0011A46B76|nr:hypothetical protein [Aeoliella mucimassa]